MSIIELRQTGALLAVLAAIVAGGCATSPTLVYENQNAIYTMHADGTGNVKIVDNAKHPCWIPQVKDKIVFARFQGTRAAIFVADADGKNPTQLTAYDASENFCWSADRKWIGFETDRHGNWQIYKINVSTKQEIRLTNNSFNDRKPRWSPQGNQIAFQSDRRNGDWDVWVMGADGSSAENLTNGLIGDGYDGDAVWSPDGKYVAHRCNHVGWGGPTICLAVLPTSGTPSATGPFAQYPAPSAEPAWSPSGDYIFYIDSKNTLYKQEVGTKKAQALATVSPGVSASTHLDANETTLFFPKGNDLYAMQWRTATGEKKLTQGHHPDVW